MRRNLSIIAAKEQDLIIVGGGIFGACAAWEAADRGLSVTLLERGDFSHATSANHLRMIHGGIRYLQHLDLPRIHESSRERSAFLRIVPHLSQVLPIVVPTYGHGMKGKELLGMGFFAYDLLTWRRNRGIRDGAKRIPRGSFLPRERILEEFPGLSEEGLTGGGVFHDGQMHNPARIALAFVRSAELAGASVANYVEVDGILREGDRVTGVRGLDLLTGKRYEFGGRVVLNAAGPWADGILQRTLGLELKPKPTFSRDLALVLSKCVNPRYGLAVQTKSADADALLSRGGRHLFIVPWRGRTLVGVWHRVYRESPDEVTATEEELDGFVREANGAYPALELSRDDIFTVLSGLTLFGDERVQTGGEMSFGKRSLLIDHEHEHRIRGLLTVIGVRATTGRGVVEKAVDLVLKKLGRRPVRSSTADKPVYGGEIDSLEELLAEAQADRPAGVSPETMSALARNHGSRYREVLDCAKENPAWAEPIGERRVLKAEVIHAVREEMAVRLADVVFRRTDLAWSPGLSEGDLRACAELMALELGWDENRLEQELSEVESAISGKGMIKRYSPERPE